MFRVETTKEMSIRHDVSGKFKASRVMLMPNKGKGLVVGGAIRDILLLAGLKNVTGKIYSRSKTHLNNAKACMNALQSIKKSTKA
jgi:small subunit ribosomal protein S5